jgi:uncharacterized protein YidB (DUF937 family)
MGLLDDLLGAGLGAAGGKDPATGGLGSLLGGLGGAGGVSQPLTELLGRLGGGNPAQSAGLMTAVMSLVQQFGGFEGLLQKLQQSGLGNVAQSWLSNGPNAALGAEQVQEVFGAAALQQAAQQAGMNAQQAAGAIGQLLPELVNQFSPQGSLAGNHAELLQQGLSMLMGGRR